MQKTTRKAGSEKRRANSLTRETHADVKLPWNRIYADNYTHTHTSGMIQSKADFVDGFRTGTRKYAVVNTSDVTVRFYSDTTATVTGHVTTTVNTDGAPLDSFLEVWFLDHGNWRCAAWAQTKAPVRK